MYLAVEQASLRCFFLPRHRFRTVALSTGLTLPGTTKRAPTLSISLGPSTETGRFERSGSVCEQWSECLAGVVLDAAHSQCTVSQDSFMGSSRDIVTFALLGTESSSLAVFLLSQQCPPLFKKECNKCLQV